MKDDTSSPSLVEVVAEGDGLVQVAQFTVEVT
jgi:hypothetical protein